MAWSPAIEVVSLERAKEHLKLSPDVTADDDDLQIKLYIAHELVFDYVSQLLDDDAADARATEMETWTADTAPKRVIGAVLYQFAELYRYRGDEPGRSDPLLAPAVRLLLDRLRDPLAL